MLDLTIPTFISRVIILIIAFTTHELAHAIVADRLGDSTPRQDGRLTLNPIKHLDPVGSLLLIVAGFGWAKPVRINPLALTMRTRFGPMLVSIAGPLSNFGLALIAGLIIRTGSPILATEFSTLLPTPIGFLVEFLYINILLMIFNLLPIPPLDGEKILYFFLSPQLQQKYAQIRPYGTTILLVIIILPSLTSGAIDPLGWVIRPLMNFFIDIIFIGV